MALVAYKVVKSPHCKKPPLAKALLALVFPDFSLLEDLLPRLTKLMLNYLSNYHLLRRLKMQYRVDSYKVARYDGYNLNFKKMWDVIASEISYFPS